MTQSPESDVAPLPNSLAWLRNHRAEIQAQRDVWDRRESRRSWARLLVFLAAVVPWGFFYANPILPATITILCSIAFVYTVIFHARAREQRELHDGMLTVIDEALQRVGGKLVLIRSSAKPGTAADDPSLPTVCDDGPTWPLTDQERDDLDLYKSPLGLFGLLNRTSTEIGARRLSDMLDHPCLSISHVEKRQEAVRWLETNPTQRIRLMGAAVGLRTEAKRLAGFVRAVDHTREFKTFIPMNVLLSWSLLSGLASIVILVMIFMGDFSSGVVLAGLLTINHLILRKIDAPVREFLDPWRDVAWGALAFQRAALQAAADLPRETLLADLQQKFHEVVAQKTIPALCRRLAWMEHAGWLYSMLRYTFLYDLHVAALLLKIVVPRRDALRNGFAALAELEALASLACFAAEQPTTCCPEFQASPAVDISEGRHPLIPPRRVVPNSVRFDPDNRICIVTGSNMAGKSTFLRMIGVNILLAQIGSAVCAARMVWKPVRLMSDLQARDNLADEESYFLAEVRHLRRMVLPPDGAETLLCMIDEPFRGTNSQDQSAASVAVLSHLARGASFVLLATHDRHLTELADGGLIRNFHFREDLGSDGMVFDYHLHEGPARTRNALRVLEREGYPDRILADAHDWLSRSAEERP